MTEQKKTSFLDAIKNAQSMKTKVPQAKAQQVQQEKFKQKPGSNRPTKRASGRGG